jgi:hypothetical protein
VNSAPRATPAGGSQSIAAGAGKLKQMVRVDGNTLNLRAPRGTYLNVVV